MTGKGRSARSRGVRDPRLLAVAVSGIVLGLSSTVTLASWIDGEAARGTFAASRFATEQSVAGGAYTASTAPPGGTVTIASALGPGVSAYVPVLVRTTAGSAAGTLALGGATVAGADAATLGPVLVYRVVRATGDCSVAAFSGSPSFVVGGPSTRRPLTAGQESGTTIPVAAATTSAAGPPTGLCFELTLPVDAPGTLQGRTASATWTLEAVSA